MEIHGNFIFTKKNDNLGTSRADYPPETSSSRKATQKKSAGGNVQNSLTSSEKKMQLWSSHNSSDAEFLVVKEFF